jgi:kinesin family member 22
MKLVRFSSCYNELSTQEEIFRNDVEPLIDVVYSGVVCSPLSSLGCAFDANCSWQTVTIFAYGVTSSGKTHTMQGTRSDPGVIPRVVQAMFERREEMTHRADLAVSYMEIYKDDVYDLLVQRENVRRVWQLFHCQSANWNNQAPKLPVRENDAGMVFVANLSSVPIESAEEFNGIYKCV